MAFYCEQLLGDVVHDLRQPLSTIEWSACYLEMMLGDSNPRAVEQVRMIQRQIVEAARVLAGAAAELHRMRDQRTVAENLDLTNAATAGVT
jgi:signal transduction histidine kinase